LQQVVSGQEDREMAGRSRVKAEDGN